MVDACEAEVDEGKAAQTVDGLVGFEDAGSHVVDQLAYGRLVHCRHYAPDSGKSGIPGWTLP